MTRVSRRESVQGVISDCLADSMNISKKEGGVLALCLWGRYVLKMNFSVGVNM